MAFTIKDFHDLIVVLERQPEWRAELRRLVLTDEMLSLPRLVQELVEAQRHTEEQVRELAEAQRRAEERMTGLEAAVERLAEAQRRTEERVSALEAAVERLAEAQRRTEERVSALEAAVERLAEAQRRTEIAVQALSREFGEFRRVFGATVEEEAESVLRAVLGDKGYRLLEEPRTVVLDGELDVVMPVVDPAGQELWVVVEAKARQSWRAVEAWANRVRAEGFRARLAEAGVPGPYLAYAFGIRIDEGTLQAAQKFGIGLVTGRGERVAPAGPILAPG